MGMILEWNYKPVPRLFTPPGALRTLPVKGGLRAQHRHALARAKPIAKDGPHQPEDESQGQENASPPMAWTENTPIWAPIQ